MEKTKLGITISLLGGALYFIGLAGMIPLIIAAGYVLVVEENEWLKRVAVKAVGVVIFFTILTSLLNLLGNSTSFLSQLVSLFRGSINLADVNNVIAILRTVLAFLQTLTLLLLGFKAMKMGDVGVGPVDAKIKTNM